jgi:CBS domain-containing protein
LENFATNKPSSKDNENSRGSLISDTVFYTDQQSEMQYFQTLSYNNTPLTTFANSIVSEVGLWLKCELITLLFVGLVFSIVTDTDMSSKLLRFPINVSV